ncbi:MAG TPA: hypothetical protein PLP19_21535 [bacterium]|nr:hypothetical protein [bacterium]HPN46081.1 hypothetical protein [bacterium]
MKKENKHEDMLTEYDFSQGIRGKYARQYEEGANIVKIDPDLLDYFPDQKSVNEALRSLVAIIKKYEKIQQ